MEAVHFGSPILRAPVKIAVIDSAEVELLAEKCEHGDKLAENEHSMAAVNNLREQLLQGFHLSRWAAGIRICQTEQAQVAAGLAEAEQRGEHDHPGLAFTVFGGRVRHLALGAS